MSSSTGNQGCRGTFRIDVGIRRADEPWIRSSASAPPRVADCPNRWTLTELGGDIAIPDGYGIDGHTDLFALAEVVRWQWEAVGLPFLDSAGDRAFLDAWSRRAR
ncbi:MAG: hypothetical protein S0880_13660 [Actinomycetota bacterium]|nr:hypothetical protein [Actinomycetota bacterium]